MPLIARSLALLLAAAPRSVPEPSARSACVEEPGARLHDGFFARSAPGVAFYRAVVEDRGAEPRRNRIRGVAQSAVLAVGGTPAPGLVVGGLIFTARVDPEFVEENRTVSPDDDSVKLTVLHVGPFVDWYPDPRRGFHAQLALSFVAQVESDTKGNPVEPPALGGAAAFGLGYEWFLSSEFSVGGLARVAGGALERSPRDGAERMLFLIPELALTVTYH